MDLREGAGDLLCRGFRFSSEGCGVDDLVAINLGGNHHSTVRHYCHSQALVAIGPGLSNSQC